MIGLARPVVPQRVAVPQVVRIGAVLDAAEALVGGSFRLVEHSLFKVLNVVPADLVLGVRVTQLLVFDSQAFNLLLEIFDDLLLRFHLGNHLCHTFLHLVKVLRHLCHLLGIFLPKFLGQKWISLTAFRMDRNTLLAAWRSAEALSWLTLLLAWRLSVALGRITFSC